MKDLLIRPERCTGCRSCEIACTVAHSKSRNLFSAVGEQPAPNKRIYVNCTPNLEISIPITCRHCEDAPCVSVCPTQAISLDETNSFVSFSPERCVDCWTSSMASNRGVISRQTDAGIKCDLCVGREIPACVEACPTHALVFCEIEEALGTRRSEIIPKKTINFC